MLYLNLVFLLALISNTFSISIDIDPVNGVDGEDCLKEDGICKTIKYTFEHALNNYSILFHGGNYGENDCPKTKGSKDISVGGHGKSTQLSFINGTADTLLSFDEADNVSITDIAVSNVTYAVISFSNSNYLYLHSIWLMQDSFVGSFQTPFVFSASNNISFHFKESFYVTKTVYLIFSLFF